MKRILRIYIFPVLLLFLAACQTDNLGTLNLDSVMTLKAKQQALAQIESVSAHQYSPQALAGMREALATTGMKTPEIILLTLPSSFREYSGASLEKYKKESGTPLPPFAEVLWEHRETGVRVLMGKADMTASTVTGTPRNEFIGQLEEIIQTYDEMYKKEHSSQASGKIEELGNLLKVTVTGKFLKGADWQTDRRLFYLYKPEYRLSILISGKDEGLAAVDAELAEALLLLEKRLTQLFPEGIPFRPAS